VTNSAPSRGSFSAHPPEGESSSTDFSLVAASWVDQDLPLAYSFFQSTSCDGDMFVLLHQQSAVSWTSSMLSEGCASNGFNTVTRVKVTDSYGASTLMTSDAIVVTNTATHSVRTDVLGTKLLVANQELSQDKKLQILNFPFFGNSSEESEVSDHVMFSLTLNTDIANSVEYDFDVFVTLVHSFRENVALLKQSSVGYANLAEEAMLEAVITAVNTVNSFASNTDTAGYDVSSYDPNVQFLTGLSELFALYNSAAAEDSSARRLQGGLFTVDALLTDIMAASTNINDILFGQLAIGESSFEEFDGFYVRSSKSLFSSLNSDTFPVSPRDNVTMVDLLGVDDVLTYGLSSIQFKDASASVCAANSMTPCEVLYPTLTSVAYVNALSSSSWSQTSDFSFMNELPAIDLPGRRSASLKVEECQGSGTPTVPFDCSADTEWGSSYSSAVSCADSVTSDLVYGTWTMTCPVYNTTVACSSDASSTCRPVTVAAGATVCSCDSDYALAPADTSSTGSVIGAAGFTKFRTEISSNAVYEVAVVVEPTLVFASPVPSSAPSAEPSGQPTEVPTAEPSAVPTIAPSEATEERETVVIGVDSTGLWILLVGVFLLFLLVLLLFCCCRKKEKYWLPWMEVNINSTWVLRELVDEVHCTFDDDDFTEMLFELDQPFDDVFTDELISDKKTLARDYPVRKEKKDGWQDQNVSDESLCVSVVDQEQHLASDDNLDELVAELGAGFGGVSQEKEERIAVVIPPLSEQQKQNWQDVNDAFHDILIRDEVDERCRDGSIAEMEAELFQDNRAARSDRLVVVIDPPARAVADLLPLQKMHLSRSDELTASFAEVVLHSGVLMMKGGGDRGHAKMKDWEKTFISIVEESENKHVINFYNEEGSELRGSIACAGSHIGTQVMPSPDHEHAFILSNSSEYGFKWQLKAESAEAQYNWVKMFTKACNVDLVDENQIELNFEVDTGEGDYEL
jgi:hypothetical protein